MSSFLSKNVQGNKYCKCYSEMYPLFFTWDCTSNFLWMTIIPSLFGPTWLIWIVQVMLTYLVYEKQKNMRMMMKMHGLGDLPYWTITYAYFLCLSASYMLCFTIFGSLIGKLISFWLHPWSQSLKTKNTCYRYKVIHFK